MRDAPRTAIVIVVALLVSVATWAVGWWGVVPVAAVAGWLLRDVRGTAAWTTLGAVLGWALVLGVDATGGRFGALAHVLAGTLGLPAAALVVLTLAFPALLGWSTVTLVTTVVERRRLRDREPTSLRP